MANKIRSDAGGTKIEPESAPCSKANRESCDSGLERLPPEIRRQLLSILDLPRLKMLVRASPTFHEQYRFDRKYFLCRSIEETLGSATVDAYAVSHSTVLAGGTEQTTTWDLNSYLEKSKRRYLSHSKNSTEENATSIASFYFHTAKPIAEQYARWSLDNLATFVAEDSHSPQKGVTYILTNMETIRFAQAIYHFQVLCQVANHNNRHQIFGSSRSMGSREDNISAFLDVLEPWEIEGMFSFYQFAREVYDNVFAKIRWDVHPDNPKFDDQGRPPTPDGAFNLDNGWDGGNYLEGTTLNGLSLLHTALFKIKDHEHLVSTMQQHIVSSYIPFNANEGTLGEATQNWRRSNHPSERDRMTEERAAFPFRGDRDAPDAPPLAWTIMWHNTYSNLYGTYIPDEMRRWGYVFWDAATLEDLGGKRVLHKQWEEPYDAYDPREDLFY